MSTVIRMQVAIMMGTGLPVDDVMNTWHFRSTAVDPLDDVDIALGAIVPFYQAIDGLMSANCEGTVTVKSYDLTDLEPRVPLRTDTFEITPASGFALPNEVAICLSLKGAVTSGIDAARRRGRLYLGPWDVDVLDDGAPDSIVDSATTALIAGSAQTALESLAETTCEWGVFSPTTAGAGPWDATTLFLATAPVVGGFVDNAFDTIRSRGAASTIRVNWPS